MGFPIETRRVFSPHHNGEEVSRSQSQSWATRDLVLYCGRHDYGTRILKRTGNLAAVMRTMGHKDVKTAMQYQHPELEIVRAALDHDTAVEKRA